MPEVSMTIQGTLRSLLLIASLLLPTTGRSQTATVPVYHEAWCPSVDATRMTPMVRTAAVARGVQPASDCHLRAGAHYLGISGASAVSASAAVEREKTEHVSGYTKDDGTIVRPYWRSERDAPPQQTMAVSPYIRQ
jgi:hypothetical protein